MSQVLMLLELEHTLLYLLVTLSLLARLLQTWLGGVWSSLVSDGQCRTVADRLRWLYRAETVWYPPLRRSLCCSKMFRLRH